MYVLAPREPRWQGKRLSQWLAVDYPDDERERAQAAVRAIGKKAIPTFLRMVQAKDSALRLKVMALAEKQSWVKIDFTCQDESRRDGAYGFRLLGPEAKGALPELVKLFHEEDTALYAALAMPKIGPESVAILREGLRNPCLKVRIASADALSEAGSNGWAVVPDLVARLKDTNEHTDVWWKAADSLGELHVQADLVVPALVEHLRDYDPMVSSASATALGEYGTQATSALPALLKALPKTALNWNNCREGITWEAITNALPKIDPSIDLDAAVRGQEKHTGPSD